MPAFAGHDGGKGIDFFGERLAYYTRLNLMAAFTLFTQPG